MVIVRGFARVAAGWRAVTRGSVLVAGTLVLLLVACPGQATERVSQPFLGVTLERIVRSDPRPQIIHIAVVNPAVSGVRFMVSPANGDPNGSLPGDPNLETTRQTTLQFITAQHAQLGINGAFFTFVKHTLDTNDVSLVVSDGQVVSPLDPERAWVLNITADNQVQIRKVHPDQVGRPSSGLYNAISGSDLLVQHGKVVAPNRSPFDRNHPPRTAVAITAQGRLLLVTVDGRQPGFAEGMSLRELACFLVAHGAVAALNFDGGGSTTMAIADPRPRIINFPSDHKADGQPGRPRAVGVSLAVFAQADPYYQPLPVLQSPHHPGDHP